MSAMGQKRSWPEITAEILEVSRYPVNKKKIMNKANLSFAQLTEYLSLLIRMGLLEIHKEEGKNVYRITDTGKKYLDSYKEISGLLEDNKIIEFIA
jgi:predicted transcriptional regulator